MIEAMKQALEALENGKRVRACEGGTKYQPDLEDAAITALRQSIEQAEKQEPVDIHCPSCLHSFAVVPVAKSEWIGLSDSEAEIYANQFNGIRLVKGIEALLKRRNT
jgi:hypothetical protein